MAIGVRSSCILFGGGGEMGNLNLVVVQEGDWTGMVVIVFTATWEIREKSSLELMYLLLE
jgi:hypothetical protein